MIIEIDIEDYIDMLEDRWDNVPESWHNELADGLHDELMDFIRECPPNAKYANPSYIIDNYFVNGEFYSKEEISELYELESEEDINSKWEELCEDSLFYNDKFCCKQF